MPETKDGDAAGVQTRITGLVSRAKAAEATAASEKVRADAAAASLTAATAKLEGMTALTEAHSALQAKFDAAQAEAKTRYSTLESMVSAGFTAADDRELAEFYHKKSGSAEPIAKWVGTLTSANAPKGLAHLYPVGTPPDTASTPPDTATATTTTQLPDSNSGAVPPVPPTGEPTAEQIHNMTDAEFKEYAKRLPGYGTGRRQ